MEKQVKDTEVKKHKKLEVADTYLGLASKMLTIGAALTTVGIWAYSQYYVGSLAIQTSGPIEGLTVKLYDESGKETVYHTDRMKVAPGKYKVVVEGKDTQTSNYPISVQFNQVSVVSHTVQAAPSEQSTEIGFEEPNNADQQSSSKNRRWWQFWRRD